MSAVLFLAAALAATLPLSEGGLPDRKNGIDVHAWQVYTNKLLEKIFPGDRVAQAQIIIVEDDEVNALAEFEENAISIHSGLLRLVRDEAEYAFVITHEAQHILNQHGSIFRITGWFRVEEDLALLRRQEIMADILAADTLRRIGIDVCGGARLITHVVRRYRLYDEPENPYNSIILRRKRIANYFCRHSAVPSHGPAS